MQSLLLAVLAAVVIAILRMNHRVLEKTGIEKRNELIWILVYSSVILALWYHEWPNMFRFLLGNPWSYVILGFGIYFAQSLGAEFMKRWAFRTLLFVSIFAVLGSARNACKEDALSCPIPGATFFKSDKPAPPSQPPSKVTTIFLTVDTAWSKTVIGGLTKCISWQRMDSVAFEVMFPDTPDSNVARFPLIIKPGTEVPIHDKHGRLVHTVIANDRGESVMPNHTQAKFRVVDALSAKFHIEITDKVQK